MAKYIFITGGVVSSLGKGITAAALGALLQSHGYKIKIRKLDPYLNIDAGTMNPFEHGEVFVTDDGAETDLDLGHYERFTNRDTNTDDNVTSGKLFRAVFENERDGKYRGKTVQVIPHITDEIIKFITKETEKYDFIICEIGGTVGDIEALPFLESIRQLANRVKRFERLFIHLTLTPYVGSSAEIKTKPTQHSVKELQANGIAPDVLLVRCEYPLNNAVREKISLFCNVDTEAVVGIPTVDTTYSLPILLRERNLDKTVLRHFRLLDENSPEPDLSSWKNICNIIRNPTNGRVKVAVVGKYTDHGDAYFSIDEALTHGGIANDVSVEREYIESERFANGCNQENVGNFNAILVPGGFGLRGTSGMLNIIRHAREKEIPYLGICYGMQLAVIEAARNVANISGAGTTEEGNPEVPIIGRLESWTANGKRIMISDKYRIGGTMRLGAYNASLTAGSRIAEIYGTHMISERHRHRYEIDKNHVDRITNESGVLFSGWSPDGEVPEIIERDDHPWFIGVQFHPELKSRPMSPHPLFASFIDAALSQSRLV